MWAYSRPHISSGEPENTAGAGIACANFSYWASLWESAQRFYISLISLALPRKQAA